MGADDLQEVVLAFLKAPSFVTAQTNGPGGWIANTGGGGLDALPESVVFVKERRLPKRAAYNVRFTDHQGMKRRFTVLLAQGDDGAWQVIGGAGGSAEDSPESTPKRGYPWANLGGGGWPRQFYAGGSIEEDNGIVRVRLRSADGIELEDTVEQGEVLFLSADAVQTPFEVELYDGAGNLVGRHTTFAF
jgi:hypothetical protein